jgi:aspartate racemase
MSWESSALYYQQINELVRERLGGLHSAHCIMTSVDFADIERLQATGSWDEAGRALAEEARRLESAGADFIVLCTNTMHKVAATARAVNDTGITTVGLLGTAFTMEQTFYIDRLASHGLTVIVPEESQRAIVHRVIYEELVLGVITEASRQKYRTIIASLRNRGAEGVVLGCTEIELLIEQKDSLIPVFATTRIHAEAAVQMALTVD